jgi:hypothetical protein
VPAPGQYDVYAQWRANVNRSSTVPYLINHASGQATVVVNQKVNGGAWNLLGRYSFTVGTGGWVEISDANGAQASADAIRLVPSP